MSQEPLPRDDTYVIDPESPTEMARLLKQHRFITQQMGELFPQENDLSEVHTLLDVCCGPGGWALDMGFTFPDKQITGVDISHTMINYAKAQARVQFLDNVEFAVMDAMKPFTYPDNAFDMVNARFLFGVLPKTVWPTFLQECYRVTRPGGIIQLTEPEWTISNSEAFEQMGSMVTRALKIAGHSFSPDGRHVGLTPMLPQLLRKAGYLNVHKKSYGGEFSAEDEDFFEMYYQNYLVVFQVIKPFLFHLKITTPEEFDKTFQRMQTDMLSTGFSAIGYALTAWAFKPA